jgi:hypothetical protein
VRPIGEFIEACARVFEDEYCAQHPHPVFLHRPSAQALRPVEDMTKQTFDRGVLDRSPPPAPEENPPPELAALKPELRYSVYVIRGGKGGDAPSSSSITVGSGFDCDVWINDESVSMRHAHVTIRGGEYRLRDNQSTTGTQINDKPLAPGEERPLRSGDEVRLGYVELTFLTAGGFYRLVRRLPVP